MIETKDRVQIFLAIAIAGALELPLTALIFAKNPASLPAYLLATPRTAILLHIAAGLILFFFPPREGGLLHHQRLWGRLFLSFGIFFPAFGWLICFALYFFYKPPRETESLFNSDPVFEDDKLSVLELPDPAITPEEQRQRMIEAVDLMPLADILATHDSALKRGAVEKLAQLASPEAIAVLQDHRSTPQPEVRFYIITALTRIKKDLEEEIEAVRAALKKDPTSLSLRLSAARTYFKMAKSGLADEFTRNTLLKEALYQLEASLGGPNLPCDSFELIVDIHALKRHWNEALATLDQWQKHPQANLNTILKKRISVSYEAGLFSHVIESLRALLATGERDPKWQASAYLWGGQS